jgi:hypothetical protein
VVKEKETPQVGGEGGGFWVTRVRQREEAEKQSLLVSSSSSFSFFFAVYQLGRRERV